MLGHGLFSRYQPVFLHFPKGDPVMMAHRVLIITLLALVALFITTGVTFPQGSTADQGTDHINDINLDSPVTTREDNKFTQEVRIPNTPPGIQVSRAVTHDLEATT